MQDQHLLFTLLTPKLRILADLVLLNSCVGVWMGKTTRMGGTLWPQNPIPSLPQNTQGLLGAFPSGQSIKRYSKCWGLRGVMLPTLAGMV